MVTIGPVVLLCLLGATFYLGSRYRRRRWRRASHGGSEALARSRVSEGSVSSVSLVIRRRSSGVTKMFNKHSVDGETDSTKHPLPYLNTRDHVPKPKQALATAIVRHGGGVVGEGLFLSPPGRGGEKGVASAQNSGQMLV